MPATEPKSVRSVAEFRRLYYPRPEPALEYFDGVEPEHVPTEDENEVVCADPLDVFDGLVGERESTGPARKAR